MTRALLEQALEALDSCNSDLAEQWFDFNRVEPAIEAIRTYLAQPQGEPVAWMHSKTGWVYCAESEVPIADGDERAEPLFTHPAHMEAEVTLILDAFDNIELRRDLAREIRRILGVSKP